jgi:hypothetical protein
MKSESSKRMCDIPNLNPWMRNMVNVYQKVSLSCSRGKSSQRSRGLTPGRHTQEPDARSQTPGFLNSSWK